MNGREAARHISALRPGIRVLYMSGYADDVLGAAGSNEVDLVQKPVSGEHLLSRVRQALAAKTA
jgi:CheY-like chemotaxis protein